MSQSSLSSHLQDFPDRLSPMLVKELRQGLRTRTFVAIFLALQIVLGIILLTAGAAATSDHAGSTISNIIFLFFSIAVLLLQPMHGIGAVSSEIKDNTLDMLALTRLSSWRIVLGKWFAIVTQSGLLLVTIIPYLILRYFFGGMNLVGEIVLLGLIFFTSATLTAVTVGLSASRSVILRSILPMIMLPIGGWSLLMFLSFEGGTQFLVELCSLESKSAVIAILLYLATCSYFGFYMLSLGTSLIASYAENYSTLRRCISLLVMAIAAAICSTALVDPEAVPVVVFLIMVPAFTMALTEFAPPAPPTYHSFNRFGPLSHILRFFLLPGWPSGVFFSLLLTAIAIIPYLLNPVTPAALMISNESGFITSNFTMLGSLLFPAILINLFRAKNAQRISNYILLGLASTVFAASIFAISQTLSNPSFLWLFVWLPPIQIMMLDHSYFHEAAMLASIFITGIYFLILLVMALPKYWESIEAITSSTALLKEKKK